MRLDEHQGGPNPHPPVPFCHLCTATSPSHTPTSTPSRPCACRAAAGPVNIHERVLRAMSVPGQNHRDPWFAKVYTECLEMSKWMYQTKVRVPGLL